MNLENAIEIILQGNALLFCGSGFSFGAKNIDNEEIASVKGLLEKMCIKLGIEFDEELEYVAEQYVEEFGEDNLIELLIRTFTVKDVGKHHKDIVSLPWRRIYTTNYDDVIEKSTSGKIKKTITLKKPINEVRNLEEVVIHLNGSIYELTKEKLNSEFKLTSTSYLSEEFIKTDWYELFKNDVESCGAIFFIGYSFKYDLDIKRVFASNDIKEKVFFINKETKPGKDRNKIEKFGTIVESDNVNFSKKLMEFKKEYIIPVGFDKPLYSFKKYEFNDQKYNKISHLDIIKLLSGGTFSEETYFSNSMNEVYLFNRDIEKYILKDIKENGKNIIIIHSDLGNGKTIFLEMLKKSLSNIGNVYHFFNKNEKYYDDLENIISSTAKNKFIVIENYNIYLHILHALEKFNTESIILILTARSFIHDLTSMNLKKLNFYFEDKVSEYNLNTLSNKEINQIINYFNKNDLWGNYADKDYKYKKEIIVRGCDKNLSSLLLEIFNSPQISKEIEEIVKNLNNNEIEELLIVILINNVINTELSKSDIISYLNLQGKFDIFLKDDNLRQLLVTENKKLKIKSSIMGKYLLDNYVNKEKTIDILIKLMKTTDNYSSKTANNLKFTLVSFSNFQLLVKNNTEKNILRYYEGIKNLKYCKTNAFFWIQYANARISVKDFEFANLCLKNASAFRKLDSAPHYDTCYARYLLEHQIYNSYQENAYNIFKQAHELLLNTKNEKNKWHFPFKQTQIYKRYYDKFFSTFSPDEKAMFLFNILEMVQKIEKYNEIRKNNNDDIYYRVKIAERQLKEILNQNEIDEKEFLNYKIY